MSSAASGFKKSQRHAISTSTTTRFRICSSVPKAVVCKIMNCAVDLEQRRDAGQRWTERAREALEGSKPLTVQLLEELSDASSEIPVVLDVAQDVSNALAKAKELQKTVQNIHKNLQAGGQPSAGADLDGDLSMISVSENSEAADRMALLPDARRALRAVRRTTWTSNMPTRSRRLFRSTTTGGLLTIRSYRASLFPVVASPTLIAKQSWTGS